MKKIITLILVLFLFTGCNKERKKQEQIKKENQEKEVVETYKDENPVKIAFYENGKILKDYQTNLQCMIDINVFGVLLTNDEEVPNASYKTLFNDYYNRYEEKEKYKIGYYVKFYTGDTLHEKTIIDPTSTFSLNPYMFIYLYDDIHHPDGAWYSHVEEKDVTDETLYTSIKLTKITNCKDITSPITLEAFTYDSEDDFDENGNYRGNSKYSIEIKVN